MKIDPNKKMKVYFDLYDKTWTVRQDENTCQEMPSGKKVGQWNYIQVKNPQYVVHQEGKERVRREKQKNIHAYICGYVIEELPSMPSRQEFISYDPYKDDSFVIHNTNNSIHSSPYAMMQITNRKPIVKALWY